MTLANLSRAAVQVLKRGANAGLLAIVAFSSLTVLAPLFVSPAAHATGNTRYVDASIGNNTYTCLDPTHPCRTIQKAIDNSVDGDTISVASGTYTENPTIDKAVTLEGADSYGSVIDGQVTISASGAAIDGFAITNPSGDYGIVIPHVSNVTVSNNDIHDIGTSVTSTNLYGIWYQGSTAVGSASDITISGNTISTVGSVSNAHSDGGILIGDSASHQNTSGLVISDNTVSSIYSSTKGAYGILINLGSGADTAQVSGASISGNSVSGLSGGWEHAIGLEADTPNAELSDNTVSGDAAVVAVRFEENPSASTVSMSGNTFNGDSLSNSTAAVAVDSDWSALSTASSTYTEVSLNGQYYYYGLNAFGTIANGLGAVDSGGTVNVAAGTYNENLVISNPVSLIGPNDGLPGSGGRSSEATVNGGGGFAITLKAPNVTISGFTISASSTGDGIYNIDASTSGHDISGTVITDNVFSGSSRAVALESNATGTVKISDNLFDSNDKDLAIADNSFGDLQVEGNTFNEPVTNDTGVQIGPDGTGTISSFEFENNDVTGNVNIGSNVEGANVSSNTFNYGTPTGGSVEFQAALHDGSVVSNNAFYGNSDYACLQLFGSQYGLIASDDVTVSGNDFHDCGNSTSPYYNYAVQLSQDVNNITISGNTIDNAYDGINTRFFSGSAWTLNSGISISGNQITNSRNFAINNTVNGTLNASGNWFGQTSSPSSLVSSNVTFSPWCAQTDCTSYLSDTSLTITPTSGVGTTSSSGSTQLNGSGSVSSSTATIPASTQVTAKSSDGSTNTSWDGVIQPPTVTNYTVPGDTTTSLAITVGADDGSSLTFDQPVKLVLANQAGKSVGFLKNGSFTAITHACSGTPTIGDLNALDPVGACYENSGSDLIVWTDHFTTFATYTKKSSSGGSNSSGSSTTSQQATASNATFTSFSSSKVLGAKTTNPSHTAISATSTTSPSAIAAATTKGLKWFEWLTIVVVAALALLSASYIYRTSKRTRN